MISTLLLRCLPLAAVVALAAPGTPTTGTGAGSTGAPAAGVPGAPGAKIKLGTLVPKGSSYFKTLQAMGEKWRTAPGGGVTLTIYADGSLGSESDMVRRMRAGTLHAGLLTVVGIADIEPAVSGLGSLPFTFRSLEEVDHVGQKLRPKLEKLLADKGFTVLFWTDSGWIRFFTKSAAITPDDFRKLKFFAWAGDAHEGEVIKAVGFKPVPLQPSDILPALQTGMLEAVPMPPFYALAAQVDTHAPHMLDLEYAPLVGACVVTSKAWGEVPAEAREALLAAAREAGRDTTARARAESVEAVQAMVKRGLQVHSLTPEARKAWNELHEKVDPLVRGGVVPAEIFDEVQAILRAYRESHGDPH